MDFRKWTGRTVAVLGVLGTGFYGLAATPLAPTPPAPSRPVCNAGGPYTVECSGPLTPVQLNGAGSFGSAGGNLQFFWESTCPSATLDDPTSPMPILTVDMTGSCSGTCRMFLRVTENGKSSTCYADIVVLDTTPPSLACPQNLVLGNGAPTDPIATGFATATDFCNPSPTVTYADVITSSPSAAPKGGPLAFTITRTWTADDGCQQASCDQTIRVARFYQPHIDITPGACPNPFTPGAEATLPVSVVGNEFDIADVNIETLRMVEIPNFERGGEVDYINPVAIRIEDSATPFIGPTCGCHPLGPDGIDDLDMDFDTVEMTAAFKLGQKPPGTLVQLEIQGYLWDGTFFAGSDCILIQ
jgi:hypothetical protein